MPRLELRLLGGLDARIGGRKVAFPTRQCGLLLAYLGVTPGMSQSRDRLATLFWSESADEQARASLRQTLYRLRQLFQEIDRSPLVSDSREVGLADELVWCDVPAFEAAVAGDADALPDALDLYGGELLADCGRTDPIFEEWLAERRQRLKDLATEGFRRLAVMHKEARRFREMEASARKLAELDPYDEEARRLHMTACVLRGQRNTALAVYKDLADLLRRELDVEPEPETTALFKSIREGERPDADTPAERAAATDTPEGAQPLALPAKPSIAVLPFDNMSDDASQEYFSDGITEDLITALSRIRGFFVIARNSTFTYKGRAVQVRQVCRDLGARYVIEGSVRKAGNRVRITVQLIDAAEDTHLWAERYDRDIEDIFDLQEEIARTIVGAIEPELSEAERARARRKPPDSLDAWDCYHRAVWHLLKITKEDFADGFRLLHRATELDPGFAGAFGRLASAHHGTVLLGYTEDREASIKAAVDAGRRAVSLDAKSAISHFGLGRAYTLSGDADGAVSHFNTALEINPSFALAHHGLVTALGLLGRHDDAVDHADMALRLSPRDPLIWSFLQAKAHQLYYLERYEDAAVTAERATRQAGAGFWCWTVLAASLAQLGRTEAAEAAVAAARQRNPEVSLDFFRTSMPAPHHDGRERYLDGLRKAGLSEN